LTRAASLKRFAAKYVWWRTPEEAVKFPRIVVAQVMELGDYDDVLKLMKIVGKGYLCSVLREAEAGMFSPRSWHYWHYRLGLAGLGEVPPLPLRKVA
jgi:hypothetical protein